jgi:putative transposase
MMRRSQEEKQEIIHLVEHSELPMKRTLDELNVPRSSFYRWYQKFQEDGEEGLIDRRPNPSQFWNHIPQAVREQVVQLALDHPDQSSRQIAWLFTDEQGYFISESSVYRILKAFDLVESPAFNMISAKDKFEHPTKRVNELWQTDFTYFKIVNWGWYYLSTILDDYSRCISDHEFQGCGSHPGDRPAKDGAGSCECLPAPTIALRQWLLLSVP